MTAPVFLVDTAALTGASHASGAPEGSRASGVSGAPEDSGASDVSGGLVTLDGPEGRHAAVVRRLRPGEPVLLTDGRGLSAECVVAEATRSGLVCRVVQRRSAPAPRPSLVVVQALPKGDRAELAVQMLTEVGADVIVPWAASRCVVQWRGERGAKALAKWRSHAREAGKQARRPWFPEVRDLAGTADVAALLRAATLPLVLHEDADRPLAGIDVPADGDIVVVVGPEGGITEAEIAAFRDAGAAAVRLGSSVLRTSTVGVAAGAALLSRTPRWR